MVYVVHITPADIGSRVVIRRRISGPLPLSDVLGTLESWSDGELRLRRTDGTTVSVPEESLVAARVVPLTPRRANRRPPAWATPLDQPGTPPRHDIAQRNDQITESDRRAGPPTTGQVDADAVGEYPGAGTNDTGDNGGDRDVSGADPGGAGPSAEVQR
ncbi:putative acetyltransferase [Parafrankia discariae]